MQPVKNPNRSPIFRLITIASAGLGSLIIGLWAFEFGLGENLRDMPPEMIGGIIAALCALAAGGTALSFFAGVDESASFVFQETQVDKLSGFHSRTAMIGKIAEAAIGTIRTGDAITKV